MVKTSRSGWTILDLTKTPSLLQLICIHGARPSAPAPPGGRPTAPGVKLRERLLLWLIGRLRGMPVPGIIPWVFRRVRSLYSADERRYFQFLRTCLQEDDWFVVFFAAHELGSVYPGAGEAVLDDLESVSGHENDLVKEAAARSWSRILEANFDRGLARLESLAERPDYARRRTAALGPVLYYERSADPDQRKRLLSYWERFRDDPRQGLRNLVQSQILERLPEP